MAEHQEHQPSKAEEREAERQAQHEAERQAQAAKEAREKEEQKRKYQETHNEFGQELFPDENPLFRQKKRVVKDNEQHVYELFRLFREQLLMDQMDSPDLDATAAALARAALGK